jgi:Cupin domain
MIIALELLSIAISRDTEASSTSEPVRVLGDEPRAQEPGSGGLARWCKSGRCRSSRTLRRESLGGMDLRHARLQGDPGGRVSTASRASTISLGSLLRARAQRRSVCTCSRFRRVSASTRTITKPTRPRSSCSKAPPNGHGPNLEQLMLVEAGDFIFIPAGVPHQPFNSTDAPARAVLARTDPNEQEGVVVIDEP